MNAGLSRFVGFAFASADLLIEIAPDGRIAFAAGAAEALSGSPDAQLVGRPWSDFIDEYDRPMADALFRGLKDGLRGGPVVVRLAQGPGGTERAAALSVFRLPQNEGAISCALTRAVPPPRTADRGLQSKDSFEQVTATLFESAKTTGLELELALVELSGLTSVRGDGGELDRELAGLLRAHSHGGSAAAELGEDRFALVRPRGESPESLARRLLRMLGVPEEAVRPAGQAISLTGQASPNQVIRAIRYAVDSFITEGLDAALPASLSEAVTDSVRRTAMEVGALGQALAEKQFRLVYQPVVNLKAGGAVHHHEVLVRFGQDESPFPMIRMAEELDLIESLDVAVAEQAIAKLIASPGLKLAVNMSGRSAQSPSFVAKVAQMIASSPAARGRLLFELTESAAITDMPTAQASLQMLREEGCKLCLDDFGAGAASLAYVQQLPLDFVKIDGRYIKELQHGGRETTFIRHLVRMCAELGVGTIAEMVETKPAEQAVRQAGVDLAQGYLYGAPLDEPARIEARPPAIRPGLKRAAG